MKKTFLFLSMILLSATYLFAQPTATLSFPDVEGAPGTITVPLVVDAISGDVMGNQLYCQYDPDHLTYVETTFPHPNFPAAEWFAGSNGTEVGMNWFAPDFVAETILPGEAFAEIVFDWDGTPTNLIWGTSADGVTEMYDASLEGYVLTLIDGSVMIPPLEEPQNLAGEIVDDNDILLTWEAPATDAFQSYSIYRNGSLLVDNITALTYTDMDLADDTYTYCVTAVYDEGESGCSNEVTLTVDANIDPPTNLMGYVVHNNVKLMWDPITTDAFLGFKVYRDGAEIAFISENEFIDSGLADGTYTYCVTTFYDEGESDCAEVILTVDTSVPTDPTATLSYPQLIQGPGSVTVPILVEDINDNVFAAQFYCFYDSDHLTFSTVTFPNANFPESEWFFGDNGERVGTNWVPEDFLPEYIFPGEEFAIIHFDWDGEPCTFTWGNESLMFNDQFLEYNSTLIEGFVVQEYFAPPTNLTADVVDDVDIQLAWDAPVTDALVGYNIYKNGDFYMFTDQTSYLDEDLANGTYAYCVTAVYDDGESFCSNTAEATIFFFYPPTNLTAEVVTWNDILLNWTAPGGQDGFSIYRDGVYYAYTEDVTYTDMDLANGTYCYTVTAMYGADESDPTNEACATVDVPDLDPPTNLTATYVEPDDIMLSWNPPGSSDVFFEELFDDMTAGEQLACQGNSDWTTWSNNPCSAEDGYVSSDQSFSPSNSLLIEGTNDMVHVFDNYTSGDYLINFKIYVPTGFQGYFNTLSLFAGTSSNWAMQAYFDLDGFGSCDAGGEGSGSFFFDNDTWIDVKVRANLDADEGTFWVNDELVVQWQWSIGAFGDDDLLQLGGTNFYAWSEGADPMFYIDDYVFDYYSADKDLQSYNVYYDNGTFIANTTETSYVDEDLNLGQEYCYYVKAVYDEGESPASNTACATTELETPTNLVATTDGEFIDLTWTAPGGGGSGEDFFEDFESGTLPTGWQAIDNDNDGFNWINVAEQGFGFDTYAGTGAMTSASYDNDAGALTPDNYLITPPINLGAGATLTWWHDAQDPAWADDFYYVKLSTTGTDLDDFTEILWSGTTPTDWAQVSVDLSAYSGQVYLAFQHTECTDWFWMKIDDVAVTGTDTKAQYTAPIAKVENQGMPFRTSGMNEDEIKAAHDSYNSMTRDLTGYNIYYEDGTFVGSSTGTFYSDGPLTTGTYCYYVTAVYDEGESGPSNIDCADVILELDPPYDLEANYQGNQDILVTWTSPITPVETWLHWDDGTNGNSIGLTDGGSFFSGSRWEPSDLEDYDGTYLTELTFFAGDYVDCEFTIKVWTGANAGTEMYSESFGAYVPNDWNTHVLSTPVMIDASQELWFGYETTHPAGAFPAGTDLGPAVANNGDMISLNGSSWESMSISYALDYNWNIQAFVTNNTDLPTAVPMVKTTIDNPSAPEFGIVESAQLSTFEQPTRAFQSFDLYYDDGTFITNTTATEYLDEDLVPGEYCYYAVAVYDEGESDPSNTDCAIVPDGVNENALSTLQVYPNPATTSVNIVSDENIRSLEVYNYAGQMIFSDRVENKSFEIDVHGFDTGVYVFKVFTNDNIINQRVVIK